MSDDDKTAPFACEDYPAIRRGLCGLEQEARERAFWSAEQVQELRRMNAEDEAALEAKFNPPPAHPGPVGDLPATRGLACFARPAEQPAPQVTGYNVYRGRTQEGMELIGTIDGPDCDMRKMKPVLTIEAKDLAPEDVEDFKAAWKAANRDPAALSQAYQATMVRLDAEDRGVSLEPAPGPFHYQAPRGMDQFLLDRENAERRRLGVPPRLEF